MHLKIQLRCLLLVESVQKFVKSVENVSGRLVAHMRLNFLYIVAMLQDCFIEQRNLAFGPARPRSLSCAAIQENSFVHFPLLLRSRFFSEGLNEPADPFVDLQLTGLLCSVNCSPNVICDFWNVIAKSTATLAEQPLLLRTQDQRHVLALCLAFKVSFAGDRGLFRAFEKRRMAGFGNPQELITRKVLTTWFLYNLIVLNSDSGALGTPTLGLNFAFLQFWSAHVDGVALDPLNLVKNRYGALHRAFYGCLDGILRRP
jgi:hypothetical protein